MPRITHPSRAFKKPDPKDPNKTFTTKKPSKLVARKFKAPKPIKPVLVVAKDALKIAFIGRSNVGKSSLINYLLGEKIAKTSKHPGKTREHSLYKYSNAISFVDMPGYGYAIIRKERRDQWDKDLLRLFFEDEYLAHVCVLIDLSIPPIQIDQDFVAWLLDHNIPYTVIFTKIDKTKQSDKSKTRSTWDEYLVSLRHPYSLATFEVSALKQKGGGEIKAYLNKMKKVSS